MLVVSSQYSPSPYTIPTALRLRQQPRFGLVSGVLDSFYSILYVFPNNECRPTLLESELSIVFESLYAAVPVAHALLVVGSCSREGWAWI